jgi:hypothetical protein
MLKKNVYAVFPRALEDPVAGFQAAMTTVDANCCGKFKRMT